MAACVVTPAKSDGTSQGADHNKHSLTNKVDSGRRCERGFIERDERLIKGARLMGRTRLVMRKLQVNVD